MPRPKKCRKICSSPGIKGFKPIGIARDELESITINYDEYEALKMVAYENLSQEEAAKRMDVSRPTLTRIYNSALKKLTSGIFEEKLIEIGDNTDEVKHYTFTPGRGCRNRHNNQCQ